MQFAHIQEERTERGGLMVNKKDATRNIPGERKSENRRILGNKTLDNHPLSNPLWVLPHYLTGHDTKGFSP